MSKRQIFLSTATTGFSIADGDRMIEIGCAEMIDRQRTDNSLHFYLNPGRDSHEAALQAHGIPDEFPRDKPRFAEVAPDLLSYLAGAEVIVHGADAHIAFLDQELERMGKAGFAAWAAGITDTLVMAEKMFPGKCNSLDALCDRLGVETPSLPMRVPMLDAELTGDVYVGLMRKLGGRLMAGQFKPQTEERLEYETRIRVIGVGGGGSRAVESMTGDCMTAGNWTGVELICADTDAGTQERRSAHKFIRLGCEALGAARTPEKERRAAEAAAQDIRAAINGAHMLFIAVVLGGNTGTGAAPVIARLARELGLLTVVGVITQPFGGDDARSMSDADANLAALEENADAVIVMRYARLLEVLGDGATPDVALAHANAILKNLVRDTALALNVPCHVGVDFEDVRTVLGQPGKAVIGTASARGPDRARIAGERAVANPLFEGVNLASAHSVLVLVSAARGRFKLSDSKSAMNTIRASLSPEAHIIYGTTYDDGLGDAIRVTVVATGLAQPDNNHRP